MPTQQTPKGLRGMSEQQTPEGLRGMILSLPRDDMAPQEVKNNLSSILEKKTKNDEKLLELLKKHYRLINEIPISVEETKKKKKDKKSLGSILPTFKFLTSRPKNSDKAIRIDTTTGNFVKAYKQFEKKIFPEEEEEIPDTPVEIEQLAEEKSMLNSGDLERLSNFIKKYGHVLKEYVPSLEEETIEFYDFDGYIKQPPEYKSCNFFDLDNCTVITIDGQEEYFDKLNESINKISKIWLSIRDYNTLRTQRYPGYDSPLKYPRNLVGGKRKPKKFSVKKKKKVKRSKSGRRRSKRAKK